MGIGMERRKQKSVPGSVFSKEVHAEDSTEGGWDRHLLVFILCLCV